MKYVFKSSRAINLFFIGMISLHLSSMIFSSEDKSWMDTVQEYSNSMSKTVGSSVAHLLKQYAPITTKTVVDDIALEQHVFDVYENVTNFIKDVVVHGRKQAETTFEFLAENTSSAPEMFKKETTLVDAQVVQPSVSTVVAVAVSKLQNSGEMRDSLMSSACLEKSATNSSSSTVVAGSSKQVTNIGDYYDTHYEKPVKNWKNVWGIRSWFKSSKGLEKSRSQDLVLKPQTNVVRVKNQLAAPVVKVVMDVGTVTDNIRNDDDNTEALVIQKLEIQQQKTELPTVVEPVGHEILQDVTLTVEKDIQSHTDVVHIVPAQQQIVSLGTQLIDSVLVPEDSVSKNVDSDIALPSKVDHAVLATSDQLPVIPSNVQQVALSKIDITNSIPLSQDLVLQDVVSVVAVQNDRTIEQVVAAHIVPSVVSTVHDAQSVIEIDDYYQSHYQGALAVVESLPIQENFLQQEVVSVEQLNDDNEQSLHAQAAHQPTVTKSLDVSTISSENKVEASIEPIGLTIPSFAIIGGSLLVAGVIAYKAYAYAQKRMMSGRQLIASIFAETTPVELQDVYVDMIETLYSERLTAVSAEMYNVDEKLYLTTDQLQKILDTVSVVRSKNQRQVMLAVMLTRFDMDREDRKEVGQLLRKML